MQWPIDSFRNQYTTWLVCNCSLIFLLLRLKRIMILISNNSISHAPTKLRQHKIRGSIHSAPKLTPIVRLMPRVFTVFLHWFGTWCYAVLCHVGYSCSFAGWSYLHARTRPFPFLFTVSRIVTFRLLHPPSTFDPDPCSRGAIHFNFIILNSFYT